MSEDSQAGALPLQGVRAVDFTWVWAGPYATMLLALLGAEVIKVESKGRMDLARRVVIWPLSDPQPHTVSVNQGPPFNTLNINKLSATINLGRAEGIDLVKRLVAVSDVVVENMRPGAAPAGARRASCTASRRSGTPPLPGGRP